MPNDHLRECLQKGRMTTHISLTPHPASMKALRQYRTWRTAVFACSALSYVCAEGPLLDSGSMDNPLNTTRLTAEGPREAVLLRSDQVLKLSATSSEVPAALPAALPEERLTAESRSAALPRLAASNRSQRPEPRRASASREKARPASGTEGAPVGGAPATQGDVEAAPEGRRPASTPDEMEVESETAEPRLDAAEELPVSPSDGVADLAGDEPEPELEPGNSPRPSLVAAAIGTKGQESAATSRGGPSEETPDPDEAALGDSGSITGPAIPIAPILVAPRGDIAKEEPEADAADSAIAEQSQDDEPVVDPTMAAVKELREIAQVAGRPFSLKNSTLPVLRFGEYRPRDVALSPKTSWIDLNGAVLAMGPDAPTPKKRNYKAKHVVGIPQQLEQLREAHQENDGKVLSLSRQECTQLLLQHNQEIQLERMQWEIQQEGVMRERGAFEPVLAAVAKREYTEDENTNKEQLSAVLDRNIERNNVLNSSIQGRVPTGAQYSFGYTLNRLSNDLTGFVAARTPFDSEYESFMGLSLSQPLLKNAWFKANLAPYRMAKMDSQVAYQSLRKRMMSLVGQTESGYWDLTLAQKAYELSTASVKIAEKVLEDHNARMETGKVSELEFLDAKAGLAERKATQSASHQRLVEMRNSLRSLFSDSVAKANLVIVAKESPGTTAAKPNLFDCMERAYEMNPDYLSSRHMLDKENIRVALAKNQRLPQIDLQGSYGLNGLGDTMSDSWQDINNSANKSWSVGVELRIPLGGGRSAKHESKAAKLRKKQALLSLKNLEVALSNNIDTIIQNIDSSQELTASAKVRAEFNQKLLDVELTRFKEGKGDSRSVLEVEENLFESKLQELESLVAHEKALLLVELAEGSFLKNRGIEIRAK